MPTPDIGKRSSFAAHCRHATTALLAAADSIGIRGMLVHAISDEAKAFYVGLGLDVSPLESMTLMATVADLKASLRP